MNMNKARIGKNCSVQKENSVIYPKLTRFMMQSLFITYRSVQLNL